MSEDIRKMIDVVDNFNGINLGIIGSRCFNNYSYARVKILDIIRDNKIRVSRIVSGGASGADKVAEEFANNHNIPIDIILPDWSYGKGAGFIRNTEIIKRSDYVIAFWDGESRGTLDSINKAKKFGKVLFVINISPGEINEGVRLQDDDSFLFDFADDRSGDILSLKYNKGFITSKKTRGVISYYSYKINKGIDKNLKNRLISFIKNDLILTDKYEHFLSKSVLGLFNNPYFEVGDVDLILIPESSSSLNFDLAKKLKNKIPNALFLRDAILKNEPENVSINYDMIKEKGFKDDVILDIEDMVKRATVNGVFKIKKIAPQFRRYIFNFLKMDDKNRVLMNKLIDGKVIVVDDFISEGSTFRDINRLIENYAPSEIILFSLIA